MTYFDQWKIISSRIHGLMQAGQLHADFLAIRANDTYGRGKLLREQSTLILTAIESFKNSFKDSLSPAALTSIDNFVHRISPLIKDTTGSPDTQQEQVWAILVMLTAFETELSFILSDVQQLIRSRSERAFAHLQRLIVADEDCRGKWKSAFKAGEPACEKLGAVHLLWHGIWAFKVNTTGARTDLVFQDSVGDMVKEQNYSDGLVLTEWKVLRDNGAEKLFADARAQAHRYTQGALGGNELTAYRYAVVVSQHQITVPADITEHGAIYRHINIAVDPQPPSKTKAN